MIGKGKIKLKSNRGGDGMYRDEVAARKAVYYVLSKLRQPDKLRIRHDVDGHRYVLEVHPDYLLYAKEPIELLEYVYPAEEGE